jgi:hypothetical protein
VSAGPAFRHTQLGRIAWTMYLIAASCMSGRADLALFGFETVIERSDI